MKRDQGKMEDMEDGEVEEQKLERVKRAAPPAHGRTEGWQENLEIKVFSMERSLLRSIFPSNLKKIPY